MGRLIFGFLFLLALSSQSLAADWITNGESGSSVRGKLNTLHGTDGATPGDNGGDAAVSAGAGNTTADGGSVNVTAGNGGATNGGGGSINLTGGSTTSGQSGGFLYIPGTISGIGTGGSYN